MWINSQVLQFLFVLIIKQPYHKITIFDIVTLTTLKTETRELITAFSRLSMRPCSDLSRFFLNLFWTDCSLNPPHLPSEFISDTPEEVALPIGFRLLTHLWFTSGELWMLLKNKTKTFAWPCRWLLDMLPPDSIALCWVVWQKTCFGGLSCYMHNSVMCVVLQCRDTCICIYQSLPSNVTWAIKTRLIPKFWLLSHFYWQLFTCESIT